MWSNYNYTNFPIVLVNFNGKLEEDNQYYNFIRQWTVLYSKQQNFKFIFDTTNCGYVNIKYAFMMPKFILKLKKLPNQYLEKSVIIYNNSWIKYLLVLIFKIQKPVAPVYLISKENYCDNIFDNLENIKEHLIEIFP